jgi:hypothetical protein
MEGGWQKQKSRIHNLPAIIHLVPELLILPCSNNLALNLRLPFFCVRNEMRGERGSLS